MMTRRTFLQTSALALAAAGIGRGAAAQDAPLSLVFDPGTFQLLTTTVATEAGDVAVTYRFYGPIPYVARPVDAAYQSLNIAVPVEIDGVAVDARAMPVLLANGVGGYMPSMTAGAPGIDERSPDAPAMAMPQAAEGATEAPTFSAEMMAGGARVSNARLALAAGLVVVEPGARGRTLVNDAGEYYGTAPAAIVDLKAAVRYLRHNSGLIPGDMARIVSSGTSAGGALSALLGATGDSPDYAADLAALGAAPASDAIHAAGCWCPITDLDHADMAYEWMWGANAPREGSVDAALSADLAAQFAAYQAGLGLTAAAGPLTAETYAGHLLETFIRPEATAALAAMSEADRAAYLAGHPQIGWDGTAAAFDWAGFIAHVGARKKGLPAFDAFDLSAGENNLFGLGTTQARHFTAWSAAQTGTTLDADIAAKVRQMNPMPHLAEANPGRARHWWLRVGAQDTDTSLTVVGNLDAQLRALGDAVDTRIYWDEGHGANTDAAAFVAWVRSLAG